MSTNDLVWANHHRSGRWLVRLACCALRGVWNNAGAALASLGCARAALLTSACSPAAGQSRDLAERKSS